MKRVTKRSLDFNVTAGRQSTNVGIEARPRNRAECIEIRDARTRQTLSPPERYFLRDRTDGGRDLHDEHASQIRECDRATQQKDRAATGGLR